MTINEITNKIVKTVLDDIEDGLDGICFINNFKFIVYFVEFDNYCIEIIKYDNKDNIVKEYNKIYTDIDLDEFKRAIKDFILKHSNEFNIKEGM